MKTLIQLKRYLEDPRKKLDRLLVLSTLVIAYFHLYVYQNMYNLEFELIELGILIKMPVMVLVIIPLIHYVVAKPDPLQRSPSQKKAIRFFQNEFPSKYILDRCQRCIEDENSCPNYIKQGSFAHVRYWFNTFHGPVEQEMPGTVKETYEKGYTCKLVYYLKWILTIFIGLSIGTIILYHVYLLIFDEFNLQISVLQLLFPIACAGIVILIRVLNKPDEVEPTGCWHAWRQINRIHVSWLRTNEQFLVDTICHAGGGTKMYRV